jgi:hypothetical protein
MREYRSARPSESRVVAGTPAMQSVISKETEPDRRSRTGSKPVYRENALILAGFPNKAMARSGFFERPSRPLMDKNVITLYSVSVCKFPAKLFAPEI